MIETVHSPKSNDIGTILPDSQTVLLMQQHPEQVAKIQNFLGLLNSDPNKFDRFFSLLGGAEEDYLARATKDKKTMLYRKIILSSYREGLTNRSNERMVTYYKIGDLSHFESMELRRKWNNRYGQNVVEAVLHDLAKINKENKWPN